MVIECDWRHRRVWFANQRIHHGPVGLTTALILVLCHYPRYALISAMWGITDLRDIRIWFKSGR